jgi:hypothetical integral membrane protein (TIGR02206 family)
MCTGPTGGRRLPGSPGIGLLDPIVMWELSATISPVPYWSGVVVVAVGCAGLCVAARRRPGPWIVRTSRIVGLVLVAVAVTDTVRHVGDGTWSAKTSLPLALCNFAIPVAAAACLWRTRLLAELTYFWGLTGTLMGLLTPDLNVAFPHVEFFEFVIGHAGIVFAALFLVVGARLEPRAGSVARATIITYVFTAVVGACDYALGANYMFLRHAPKQWTLLRLIGPWPWYLLTGAVVVPLLFALLDSPFRWARQHRAPSTPGPLGSSLRYR